MAVMAKTVGTPQKPPTSANTKVTSGGKIKATIDGTTYRQIVADIEAKSTPQYSPPNERGISIAGSAFLEENKARPGVVCLPSGLQYRVLKSGAATAKSPLRSTECDVHYRGKLIPAEGGIEFDSSYKRSKPATFAPGNVIQGWTIALQLMGQGDKWAIFVPPHMAYGDAGRRDENRGQYIPAGAVLCFEIELVSVHGTGKPRPARPPNYIKPTPSDGSYIAAKTFDGARTGYVFTTREHGAGYYRDSQAVEQDISEMHANPTEEVPMMATGGADHATDPRSVLGDLSNQSDGGVEVESSGLFGRAPMKKTSAKEAGLSALKLAADEIARPPPPLQPVAPPQPPPQPPPELMARMVSLTNPQDDSGAVTGRSTKSTARRRRTGTPEELALREQLAEQMWLTKATVGALETLLLRLRLPTLKHALNDLSLPSDGNKDELAARLINAMSELTPRDPNIQKEWRGIR
jgi:FKBP-type peptidyl-prolyl cis-trans isomerase